MKDHKDRRGCCQPERKVEADNTLRDLHKSLRRTEVEFSNCFVIHFKYFLMYNIVSSIEMARSLVSLQLAYFSVFLWYSFLFFSLSISVILSSRC